MSSTSPESASDKGMPGKEPLGEETAVNETPGQSTSGDQDDSTVAMNEVNTPSYICVRFMSHHEECEGTPPQTYSFSEIISGMADIDSDEPCNDMDANVYIDLTEVTTESLECDIAAVISIQGDHSNDPASLDVLIRSVYLVWDEADKPDWDVMGQSDEDLRAVLAELRDGGFKGYLDVDWYY